MEVCCSGLQRPRRLELQAAIERLRGVWSGSLTVGRTAAVVVDGAPDWAAPKLAVAAAAGIPVVSADWVLDSQAHGFLLSTAAYQLQAPPPARRSSAASTSLVPGAPVEPPSQELPPSQPPVAAPRSPTVEVEVLRGEARPLPRSPLLRSPLLAHSPASARRGAVTPGEPALVLHEQLHDPLLSPASAARQPSITSLADMLASPLGQADGPPDSTGGAAWLPAAPEVYALDATPAGLLRGWGSDVAVTDSEPSCCCSNREGSDAKVAHFLSRAAGGITLMRGTCHGRTPPDSSCSGGSASDGTSIHSSLSGSGFARQPDHPWSAAARAPATGSPAVWPMHLPDAEEEQEQAASAVPASPASCGSRSSGQQAQGGLPNPAAGLQPTPSSALQPTPSTALQQCDAQSGARLRLSEGRLPATTLVRLGPQQLRPASRATLDGIAEQHGTEAGGGPPAVTFHTSVTALPAGGAELAFVAGRCCARPGRLCASRLSCEPACFKLHSITLMLQGMPATAL